MTRSWSGGCQCGKVRYSAASLMDNPHICHCRMCQKAVGNLFAALIGVPLNELAWTRGEPSVFFSSAHIERGFCASCGTPLFYRNLNGGHISMTIGSFDHPRKIALRFQCGMEGRLPQIDGLAHLQDCGTTEDDDPAGAAAIKASNRQHPDYDTDNWPNAKSLKSKSANG